MLGKVLDFIWPRTCAVCRRPVDRPARYICSDCLMRLPFVPRDGLCRRCGRDAAGLDGEFLCEDCRRQRPGFDRAANVFRFEGDARELVNAFKFRERLEIRNDLVDFLEATVRARFRIDEIDCVAPIPATGFHRWMRGFNQCELLAKPLAKRLAKPCRNLLRRIGNPQRQGGLDEESRKTNVIGTFEPRFRTRCGEPPYRACPTPGMVTAPVPGAPPRPDVTRHSGVTSCEIPSTVLLLDDIMTTGSTLSEAAKTLKAAGVNRVWTIAIARSVRY